ncbi:MAG: hypothetical protein ACLQA5_08060 [Solirubrobacteraceae bacterium]
MRTTRKVYAQLRLAANSTSLDALVVANASFTAGYYRRLIRLRSAAYRAEVQASVAAEGDPCLFRTRAGGQGNIIITGHCGDLEIVGLWLTDVIGAQLVIPVATVPSGLMQAGYDGVRAMCGLTLCPELRVRRTSVLADALRAGRNVVLMIDRRPSVGGIDIELVGSAARVSAAPVALAKQTGSPIIGAATYNDGFGCRRLVIGSPMHVDKRAGRREAERVMAAGAAVFEEVVRRAPHQWHVPSADGQLPWAGRSAVENR